MADDIRKYPRKKKRINGKTAVDSLLNNFTIRQDRINKTNKQEINLNSG